MRATPLTAVILCALFMPLYALPTVECIQSPYFGNGQQELTISFPPGGGKNATVNLSLPAGATVLSAVMSITGLPLVSRGSIDYSAPDSLKSAPSSLNLSFDEQGARLAPFNWSWLQTSDADFKTDEALNITVSDGAHISDAVVGGVSHPFTAVSGINLTGMPSISCTPDGEILVSWTQWNQSFPGSWDACFQRFDASGIPIGPTIERSTGFQPLNQSKPRAIPDQSGRTVFLWDSRDWEDVRAAVFDRSGGQIGYEYPVGYGQYGSAVVTGPDEMFASWMPYEPYKLLRGQWLHLNGTPFRDSIVLEYGTYYPDPYDPWLSGIVSVGDDRSIAHASTVLNTTDGHLRANVLRTDSAGGLLHGAVLLGDNDTYVTPTSFAILDDGITNVAYTADYLYRNLSVRCARVAANGTIIADFSLSGTDGVFFAPSLCRLPGDRFACAWASALSGDDALLEGRLFKADGTPEGDVFQLGQARGANSSWELCARGNSSLVLVVRSEAPAPYGSVRVEVVDLQRALKGHLDSKVLDRPGTVQAAVELASGTSYSVDVLDAATRNATHTGLHNGDPVSSWTPYILRLNLQRGSFNSTEAAPVALSFGVATAIRDPFWDSALVSSNVNVTVGNGMAYLNDPADGGSLTSAELGLPYVAASLDNFSWQGNAVVQASLRSRRSGAWSGWEPVLDTPDNSLSSPAGDAVQWGLAFASHNGPQYVLTSVGLAYSLFFKTGLLLSAPANLTDGAFTGYRVNWTSDPTARALVTTDGGMTYDSASNGLWKSASGGGHALRAMMMLEGTGNSSPLLTGFRVDYESQSRPSDIELEIDGSYRWSPPQGAPLENGVEVRDFSTALNAVLARSGGVGNVTIPLNFTSATSGLLRLGGLRMVINLPPVIESSSPDDGVVLEQGAIQTFGVRASDPDGDPLVIIWTLDGDAVGTGASLDLATTDLEGNYTLRATVSDGRASISRIWNLTVIFIDHNRPPGILERFPARDPVINETENINFSVRASDPDNQPLHYAWYLDGEKVSVSDNFTYRTWYDSSGPHNVRVRVADGSLNVTTQWNVTVHNRDRPPIIRDWDPEADLSAPAGRLLQFGINASDPDGDALTFTWYLDNIQVDGASSSTFSFTTNWSDGRVHSVKAVVSDSQFNASHVWQVRSIIPGTPNPNPNPPGGVAIDRPWGFAIAIIIIVAILGTVIALYLWKKRE